MSGNPYENPYQPSSSGGMGGVPPSANALALVKGPAIGLMVTAGIGIAVQVLSLAMNALGLGMGAAAAGDQPEGMQLMVQGTVGIVMGLVALAIGVVILLGALKMQKLESYGFSMAAAILAALPCISPCCLLGLPIGIWALVVLNKPEVKSAFH